MQTITTATGRVHEVAWCGVSTLMNALIFDIVGNAGLVDAVIEFGDPANVEELRYQDGHTEDITYTGYKSLASASIDSGIVRIQLVKEAS